MAKLIIRLMVMSIILIYASYYAIVIYRMTAEFRRQYVEFDEGMYGYKRYRKLYYYCRKELLEKGGNK